MKRVSLAILAFALIALDCAAFAAPRAGATEDAQLHSQAIRALGRGSAQEAVDLLTKAIEANPSEAGYFNDRGVALRRAGKPDLAIADYTRALSLRPHFTAALNNRGVIYFELGRYKKAIRDFNKALEYKGLKSKLYTNRGLTFARMGEHHQAVADYDRALASRPVDRRAGVFKAESTAKLLERSKSRKAGQGATARDSKPGTQNLLSERAILPRKSVIKPSSSEKKRSARRKHRRVASSKTIRSLMKIAPEPVTTSPGNKNLKSFSSMPAKTGSPQKPASLEISTASKPTRTIVPSPKPVSPPIIAWGKKDKPVKPARVSAVKHSEATLEEVGRFARSQAQESYSPVASTVFAEALRYDRESEPKQALVRFEDTLHLARRQKNYRGAAWSLYEMGKLYMGLREYDRARLSFSRSLSAFDKTGAREEALLAMVGLAGSAQGQGRRDDAAEHFAKAEKRAEGLGYVRIARSLANPKWKGKPRVERSAVASAGKSPVSLKQSAALKRVRSRISVQPARQLSRLAKPETKTVPRDTIAWDLDRLERLEKSGDSRAMIPVLERLAKEYTERANYEKALHCLIASLGFRQKADKTEELPLVLDATSELRRRLGLFTQAFEDSARASVLWRLRGENERSERSGRKALKLAEKLNLNPKPSSQAMENLWTAREKGDMDSELSALYRISEIFIEAGRPEDALRYSDRLAAAVLSSKAEAYERMGRKEESDKAYQQALESLKSLDYSAYLRLIDKRRPNAKLSKNRQ